MELFTLSRNFFADFLFLVIIQSVCIVPYLLTCAIASSKFFTVLAETVADKYSFDQSLTDAFFIFPLYKFLILLSPIILHPPSSKFFKIEIPSFPTIF